MICENIIFPLERCQLWLVKILFFHLSAVNCGLWKYYDCWDNLAFFTLDHAAILYTW